MVEARKKFLEEMAKYKRWVNNFILIVIFTELINTFMHMYDNVTMEPISPVLGPGENLHVLLPRDKCITHINESPHIMWLKDGEQPL